MVNVGKFLLDMMGFIMVASLFPLVVLGSNLMNGSNALNCNNYVDYLYNGTLSFNGTLVTQVAGCAVNSIYPSLIAIMIFASVIYAIFKQDDTPQSQYQ